MNKSQSIYEVELSDGFIFEGETVEATVEAMMDYAESELKRVADIIYSLQELECLEEASQIITTANQL